VVASVPVEIEMEIHITRQAREKFNIDPSVFASNGSITFTDFNSVRLFVHKINQQNDLIVNPDKALKTSQLNAMGLMDEIFHYIFFLYKREKNLKVLTSLLISLQTKFGAERLDELLGLFVLTYPPQDVYQNRISPLEYLNGMTQAVPHREIQLENLILLWISHENPALNPFSDLIWDSAFLNHNLLKKVIDRVEKELTSMPGFGPENQNLVAMLRSPAKHIPHSITGQLEYIRDHWGFMLGDLLTRLLTSLDLVKEEEKLGFTGPGPALIPVYDQNELAMNTGQYFLDIEAFSKDRDWMPRLVLIAKNVFVWLDQLSRQYGYPITTLDQIPDAELEALSARGITGLWLIGLWERSPASARIKQLSGNPEAVSSAYSLYNYKIAEVLGGDGACEKLKEKAAHHGIRLASDMVPNHMGIDSEWVIQHPEWFLSVDQSPFPSYSFNGPDLSSDGNVQIQIEDHYYERTDAAVVFRRIDKRTDETKFIYHGNDGTSMPWNDTAQLNYLDPIVREKVIQTILEVARKFPIIRFDAAMTLAKKHIQRLWFPEPGLGGAIPSRAGFAMSKAEFDRAMPNEFWREVVERIEAEVPDTLLLAEAFWLMEGYFVRTLGMHRVYNSAFMHMLRIEDNAGYRTLLKNTLEYEPEILKRFVNFMNNPDERTAIDQFGTGDKYFGICTLMATLPGLPMFGHGQIEGFTEKYGMEYRKAYYQEKADEELVNRHVTEIIPLLYQRELFASVDAFRLFDFLSENNQVNENVFAFTNKLEDRKTLVIYNNGYESAHGRINQSVPQTSGKNFDKTKISTNIVSALGLHKKSSGYLQFRDLTTQLQFVRPVQELINNGFEFKLNGYEHHVFVDFQLVHSDALHNYADLYTKFGHNGISDIDKVFQEIRLQPILNPLHEIVNPDYLNYLYFASMNPQDRNPQINDSINGKIHALLAGVAEITKNKSDFSELQAEICRLVNAMVQMPQLAHSYAVPGTKNIQKILTPIVTEPLKKKTRWFTLAAWTVISQLGKMASLRNAVNVSLAWSEEWGLEEILKNTLRSQGIPEAEVLQSSSMLQLSVMLQDWYRDNHKKPVQEIIRGWFSSVEAQLFLKFNRFDDKLWYDHEAFQEFLWWMETLPILQAQSQKTSNRVSVAETILGVHEIIKLVKLLDDKSACQVEKLLFIE
jgi:glycosidase